MATNIRWDSEKYHKAVKQKFINITCEESWLGGRIPTKHNCNVHGMFYARPEKMMSKYIKHGCIDCGNENQGRSKRHTEETIKKLIYNKHGNKVMLNGSYKGNTKSLNEFICDQKHTWTASAGNVISQNGCPYCCRSPSFSKIEKLWIKWMKRYVNSNIMTIEDKPIRIKIPGMYCIRPDGYDPRTKTIYEFHGDYWHGNLKSKQHKNCKVGSFSMKEINRKTRKREKALLRAGYKVIYCWESDFKRYLKGRFTFRPKPFKIAKLTKSPYCK